MIYSVIDINYFNNFKLFKLLKIFCNVICVVVYKWLCIVLQWFVVLWMNILFVVFVYKFLIDYGVFCVNICFVWIVYDSW